MAGITHVFVSGKADGTDATLVRPSNWNAGHVGGLEGVPATTVNIYVSNAGSDSNDGLTSTTPKLTLQAAINLVPDAYTYNYVINIASGTHSWTGVAMIGKHAVGNVTITFQGWQNTVADQFTHTQSVVGTCSGTGGGGYWPTAFPYLLDATKDFSTYKGGNYVLHITGGTGYNATFDEQNWYCIATSSEDAGTTHLPIVGHWMIAIPGNTTTYEVIPMDKCMISGNSPILEISDCSKVNGKNIGITITSTGSACGILFKGLHGVNPFNDYSFPAYNKWTAIWGTQSAAGASYTGVLVVYGANELYFSACRFPGAGKLQAGIFKDGGPGMFFARSIFADHCSHSGIFIGGSGYAILWDIYSTANTSYGVYNEGVWADQCYGWYCTANSQYGIGAATPGTKILLNNDCKINSNLTGGILCCMGAEVQLLSSTVHVDNNTGWGVTTTVNGMTQNYGTLSGNSSGEHTESTGGVIFAMY